MSYLMIFSLSTPLTKMAKSLIVVSIYFALYYRLDSCGLLNVVSRLFAHSSNYDMDLTLDFNIELYPLKRGESFSLVLASSLTRGGDSANANGTDEAEDKDLHTWRPDGKGRRGLEVDYDYVMYGRVSLQEHMLIIST